ncbi:MAG: NHL domain-containing thioredoxin family protein [Actinomycetales bacterium]|nr:NHL domain-containing thioredoxin family protein [Actinomycetales bacterium]
MTSSRARVRAPELVGRGGWLNTGGTELSLAGLRGRIVLLDFWTFCCVNCLHVLDELRPLEEKYADVLVTVGVHSPKFVHESEHGAVVAAVERYGVHHPVLDDPDLTTWKQYAVRAWPTLTVVDPEGYVVAQLSGEGHAHALDTLLADLVAEHESKGTLHRGDGPYVAPAPREGVLSFPGKVLVLDDGTLLVSDTAHHSLAHLDADGGTLLRRIGDGTRGLRDGDAAETRFSEPNGLALLPPDVAAAVGYDVVVADTVNHAVRGVDTATWTTRTVAGTGAQWMQGEPSSGAALGVALSSPWDVAWFDGAIVVAMAGVHRLDRVDPAAGTVTPYAGTTNEGLVDGELPRAWFAQTSGLVVSADGDTLWLADSETSALRRVRNGVVTTEVGRGLFDFGLMDGPAETALLQHPLGVGMLPDGSVAVADTYNGAIRRFDPQTRTVSTLATGLAEPSDVAVVPDADRGHVLLVVESAAHRLVRVALPDEALAVEGTAYRTQRPPTDVAAGALDLEVLFTPPAGQKLDDRYGPSTYLVVSSSPPELLAAGAGSGTDLVRALRITDPAESGVDAGVLHVSVRAASCDDPDAPGAAEFPACHVHQQDWGVPVRITPDGAARLALVLAGLDA